jgi:hypothetical protein
MVLPSLNEFLTGRKFPSQITNVKLQVIKDIRDDNGNVLAEGIYGYRGTGDENVMLDLTTNSGEYKCIIYLSYEVNSYEPVIFIGVTVEDGVIKEVKEKKKTRKNKKV